ncbi:Serine/threonine-protein kinase PknK [Aquicella siphonis]|uniref:Serine/threonine-protein kinase PknK n=1 Tax=Aquicella siphonis TaxID=254247 RepID=A0A5E4PIQ8_9COXI|nr:protein kinase [Aquicella siphonis]VVC76338.1 Serine/threonine-protein kinase PknK [Aquicella siphonis]
MLSRVGMDSPEPNVFHQLQRILRQCPSPFVNHSDSCLIKTQCLDPLALTHDQSLFLGILLRCAIETNGCYYFPQGKTRIKIPGAASGSEQIIEVDLKYSLVWRQCENNPQDYRYEIVGDELGSGHFSRVYKSRGVLAPQMDGSLKLKESPRVIKEQFHDDARFDPDHAVNEYQNGVFTPHLHSKKPTFIDHQARSFSVIRYFHGEELFALINQDRKGLLFTIDQRLELSLHILYAIQEQIHSRGIVHRDVKPANILVYYDKRQESVLGCPQVNIIDLGSSKMASQPDAGSCLSTPPFAAPEVYAHAGTSVKTDVYSTARVLGFLWRADIPNLSSPGKSDSCIDLEKARIDALHYHFDNMFKGIADLDETCRARITRLLQDMSAPEQDARPDLFDAIEVFEEILADRREGVSDRQGRQDLVRARKMAAQLRRKFAAADYDESMMAGDISMALETLPDSSEVIAEFLDVLRIQALRGLTSRFAVMNQVKEVLENYHQSRCELEILQSKLSSLLREAKKPEDRFDRARAVRALLAPIDQLLQKNLRLARTLDDRLRLTHKCTKLGLKISAALSDLADQAQTQSMCESGDASVCGSGPSSDRGQKAESSREGFFAPDRHSRIVVKLNGVELTPVVKSQL